MSDKKRRLLHLLLTAAGTALCLPLGIPCAAAVLVMSAVLFVLYETAFLLRKHKVLQLCDGIDRILRSEDLISFDDYQENELSVLSAEIHKMTIRLREQNAALLAEKQFAKEALEDISHQLRTPLTSVRRSLKKSSGSNISGSCMSYSRA